MSGSLRWSVLECVPDSIPCSYDPSQACGPSRNFMPQPSVSSSPLYPLVPEVFNQMGAGTEESLLLAT